MSKFKKKHQNYESIDTNKSVTKVVHRDFKMPYPSALNILSSYKKNGIASLPEAITINGTTVLPTLRYLSQDATDTEFPAWTYGPNAPVDGGSEIELLQNPLFDVLSQSINLKSTARSYTDSAAGINIDDNDIYIECYARIRATAGGANRIFAIDSGAYRIGLFFYSSGVYQLLVISPDATIVIETIAGNVYLKNYNHFQFFLKNGGSAATYLNGEQVGTVKSVVTMTSPWDTSGYDLKIGYTGSNQNDFVFFSMYLQNSWLDTHLQDTWALQRFQQLIGSSSYASFSRTSDTMMLGAGKYYELGRDYPSIEKWLDNVGKEHIGICVKPERANRAPLSYAVESWDTLTSCTIENSTAVAGEGHISKINRRGIIGAAVSTTHEVIDGATLASTEVVKLWAIVEPGNRDWFYLGLNDGSDNGRYFNASTIATGTTVGTIVDSGIFQHEDRIYAYISYSANAGAINIKLKPSADDNSDAYTGDGSTSDLWLHHVQLESDIGCFSPIVTEGGAATRLVDAINYDFDEAVEDEITVTFNLLHPSYLTAANVSLFVLNVSGDGSNEIECLTTASNHYLRLVTRCTTGTGRTITGDTNAFDGSLKKVQIAINKTSMKLYLDGSLQASLTIDDADLPNVNKLYFRPSGAIINNFKVYRQSLGWLG